MVSSEREGKKNSAQKTPYRAGYLLSSMVYCGRCGSRYAANHGYYKCYSRSKSNKKYITNPNCKNDNWLIEELDQYVIQAIQDLLGNEKLLAEIIDSRRHQKPLYLLIDFIRYDCFMDTIILFLGKFNLAYVNKFSLYLRNWKKTKLQKDFPWDATPGENLDYFTVAPLYSFWANLTLPM